MWYGSKSPSVCAFNLNSTNSCGRWLGCLVCCYEGRNKLVRPTSLEQFDVFLCMSCSTTVTCKSGVDDIRSGPTSGLNVGNAVKRCNPGGLRSFSTGGRVAAITLDVRPVLTGFHACVDHLLGTVVSQVVIAAPIVARLHYWVNSFYTGRSFPHFISSALVRVVADEPCVSSASPHKRVFTWMGRARLFEGIGD